MQPKGSPAQNRGNLNLRLICDQIWVRFSGVQTCSFIQRFPCQICRVYGLQLKGFRTLRSDSFRDLDQWQQSIFSMALLRSAIRIKYSASSFNFLCRFFISSIFSGDILGCLIELTHQQLKEEGTRVSLARQCIHISCCKMQELQKLNSIHC